MNRPTMFLREVIVQYGKITRLAIDRDLRVIEDRVKNEGMSFLTIALPTLDDALLLGLSSGRFTLVNGFKPFQRSGSLPALLSGFFKRIFNTDGVLLDDPCFDCIEAVRQICRLYKKVELPCSDTRVKQAFERYQTNEQDISKYSYRSFNSDPLWIAITGYLWSDLELRAADIYCSPGVYGSGATAERYRLNQRLSARQWPIRGEGIFPASYHTSHREDDRESFDALSFLSGKQELPVRVVTVPKTLKTPRIIAVEPSYAMLRQQSVWRYLGDYLEGKNFPFSSIRFKDQSENRLLACSGSLSGHLATIDLSDASDRVSNRLVASTFKSCPSFRRMIFAARTRRAELPDGKLITLSKFASMGSALCFPIESMVFFSIVLTAMCRSTGERPSRQVLLRLAKDVAIYGDDIIVPTQMAPMVMKELEAFGLKVNHEKSFDTGFFRESCGGDYYKGVLNTPIYVRRLFEVQPGKRLGAEDVAAYIALSNQFYLKGLWHVSQYIRDTLAKYGIKVARSTRDVAGLTYRSFVFTDIARYDTGLSQYRIRSLVLKTAFRDDPITDCRAAMLYSHYQKTPSFEKEGVFDVVGFDAELYQQSRRYDRVRLEFILPRGTRLDTAELSARCLRGPRDLRKEQPKVSYHFPYFPQTPDDLRHLEFSGRMDSLEFRRGIPRPTSGRAYDGTSVRSYSLKLKSRLTPTLVGLSW